MRRDKFPPNDVLGNPLGLERAPKRNARATTQAGVHSARTSSVLPAVTPPQTAQNPVSCLCSCSLLSRKQYHSLAVPLQKKRQPQVAASSARGRASLATALAHLNGVATDQARSRRALRAGPFPYRPPCLTGSPGLLTHRSLALPYTLGCAALEHL